MASSLKQRSERSPQVLKLQQRASLDGREHVQAIGDEVRQFVGSPEDSSRGTTHMAQHDREARGSKGKSSTGNTFKSRRRWNAINPMAVIKLKMLVLVATMLAIALQLSFVRAGFFSFYFPNVFKPKGFSELSDMIHTLDNQLNETRDQFADSQYFWGQLQTLDQIPNDYPEESACTEVFPMFRDLAIEYMYIDFEHFIKPFELFREHLVKSRAEWYPAGLESKAALPREWEQELLERELKLKIEWLERLIGTKAYRVKREKMIEIWKSVRRSLDSSLPCIYLRYAYRQISEDINEVSLNGNLASMREAMELLQGAYARVAKFKESDKKIIEDIEEELKKVERFTIRD